MLRIKAVSSINLTDEQSLTWDEMQATPGLYKFHPADGRNKSLRLVVIKGHHGTKNKVFYAADAESTDLQDMTESRAYSTYRFVRAVGDSLTVTFSEN